MNVSLSRNLLQKVNNSHEEVNRTLDQASETQLPGDVAQHKQAIESHTALMSLLTAKSKAFHDLFMNIVSKISH